MGVEIPSYGRLLYPTVYVAREGKIQEAKTALAELVEGTPERFHPYDLTPKEPRRVAEPALLCQHVRSTVKYRRVSKKRWSKR